MTDTMADTAAGAIPVRPVDGDGAPAGVVVDEALAQSLVEKARVEGLSLTGPAGCWAP